MPRGRPRKQPVVQPAPMPAPAIPPEPAPRMPWDDAPDDIVADVLRRVMQMAPQLSAEIALSVDRQVRETWGGDRVYVPRRAGAGSSERNAAIRRDFARGERTGLLARRYGISRQRVWEIVKAAALRG